MTAAPDFEGKLYRALNPVWASRPLAGEGAARHGGRFNARGTPALYCALSPVTALREANQVGDLQPTTLVSFQAAIEKVFDFRDATALEPYGTSSAGLADPTWRDAMLGTEDAPTQKFAAALIAEGYHGLLVRSFARGSTDNDLNLVLWRWGDSEPHKVTLIDDENRLGGN